MSRSYMTFTYLKKIDGKHAQYCTVETTPNRGVREEQR